MQRIEEINDQNYLSEDVEEILTTPPSWVMTWGTATIVLVLILMGVVGYFFKYPEKVTGRVELTTPLPPEPIIAPELVEIATFKKLEGDSVRKGQLLAIKDNLANENDIAQLEYEVRKLQTEEDALVNFEPRNDLKLGEITNEYSAFLNALAKVNFEKKGAYDEKQERQIARQKVGLTNSRRSLRKKLEEAESALEVKERGVAMRQKEFTDAGRDTLRNQMARIALQEAVQVRNDAKILIAEIQSQLAQNYSDQSEATYSDYVRLYANDSREQSALANLKERLNLLDAALQNWRKENLIFAPISGEVTYFGKQSVNNIYQPNEEILYIIPKQAKGNYIGRIKLPIIRTVKIKKGQRVRLKFDQFPFRDWGYVEGKVDEMIQFPKEEQTLIQVALPNGLRTNKEKKIPFQYSMGGKAEIITEDKRFITRLLERFGDMF